MNNLLFVLQSFMFNPYKNSKNCNSKLWFTERYAENDSWQAVARTFNPDFKSMLTACFIFNIHRSLFPKIFNYPSTVKVSLTFTNLIHNYLLQDEMGDVIMAAELARSFGHVFEFPVISICRLYLNLG